MTQTGDSKCQISICIVLKIQGTISYELNFYYKNCFQLMPGVSEKAVLTHHSFCPSCSNKIMDRNLPFKISILFAKWNLTIKTNNRIVFDQCRFIFQSE